MSDLNPQQHAAMTYIDGPVLVLAGAGSGKTRVITRKIAYLIGECGYEPRSVAAVTFTNKAAREMKERVGQLVSGKNARGLIVSTFHNLGLRILRQEHKSVGLKSNFSIFDARDAAALVQELMHREVTPDKDLVQRVQWQISAWKNALVAPATALAEATDAFKTMAAVVYEEYDRHLRAFNAVDFDDLIGLPSRLLSEDADARERWQKRLRYLLVDEYQDTNGSQYALIKLLVGRRAALTVVGDDDQSIYAWRGAQPENLHLLQTDYPQLKVIKLEQNYRSTARILRVANKLIANNPHLFDKRLWSDLGLGDELRVVECRDELHEAEQVAADITHQRFSRRADYHDFAILYRGNHQSKLFEQALRSQNIPYVITGGQSFFDYVEVKDLLAYLRLLANPDDDAAFIRCVNTPRRGVGAASLEKLGSYANQRGIGLLAASGELGIEESLGQRALASIRGFTQWLDNLREMDATPLKVVYQLIEDCGYEAWIEETSTDAKQTEKRWNNVLDLLNWIKQLQEGEEPKDRLEDIVAHMSLMDILDRRDSNDERPDRVHLMTLHAAKGLEFPYVYLVGMEENLLPHRASIEASDTDANAIEEERRLAYVGITRAQRTLTFTHARRRKRAGELVVCEPSRFLAELPEDDLRWEGGKREVDPEERQERGKAHLANLRDLLK
ncbi:MAG: DNA helicase Rep [Chromatiales bacterium]|nr:DNA helicase Rep [Chromatiales bacterium]